MSSDFNGKILSPKLKFRNQSTRSLAKTVALSLSKAISVPEKDIANVFISEYLKYRDKVRQWSMQGERLISSNSGRIKILLLGRPYIVFNKTINRGIPAKLEEYGFEVMHQSMFDLGSEVFDYSSDYLDKMHWYYGQEILKAAEVAVTKDDVYPVFLTTFRCGPDAYISNYFKDMMERANKPYLVIQLDAHHRDLGYQTRIEAAVDSFFNDYKKRIKNRIQSTRKVAEVDRNVKDVSRGDTVLFTSFGPILDDIFCRVFEAHGFPAKAMLIEHKNINLGYKYVSGGECLPNVAILGAIIDAIKNGNLNTKTHLVYFVNACIACNLNQFDSLVRFGCKKAGIEALRIYNQKIGMPCTFFPKALSFDLNTSIILGFLLCRLYFRFHPYESREGATKEALDKSFRIIEKYLMRKPSFLEALVQKMSGIFSTPFFDFMIKNYYLLNRGNNCSFKKHKNTAGLFLNFRLARAAREIRSIFDGLPLGNEKKFRIAVIGDMYSRFNSVLNEQLCSLIEDFGGEVVMPSFTELFKHVFDIGSKEGASGLVGFFKLTELEKSFEQIFCGLLDDSFEPPVERYSELLGKYGIKNFIAGQVTMNLGRIIFLAEHAMVDAIVNIQPVCCSSATITSSLCRKLKKELDIPIIEVCYGGDAKSGKVIYQQLNTLFNQLKSTKVSKIQETTQVF